MMMIVIVVVMRMVMRHKDKSIMFQTHSSPTYSSSSLWSCSCLALECPVLFWVKGGGRTEDRQGIKEGQWGTATFYQHFVTDPRPTDTASFSSSSSSHSGPMWTPTGCGRGSSNSIVFNACWKIVVRSSSLVVGGWGCCCSSGKWEPTNGRWGRGRRLRRPLGNVLVGTLVSRRRRRRSRRQWRRAQELHFNVPQCCSALKGIWWRLWTEKVFSVHGSSSYSESS